ncbi:MAG: cytidylate kinase-like family protein [Muribaculaceae bacterium]|nr:cytidylate kinase-like family protein [Muribaculaceae bacterium]
MIPKDIVIVIGRTFGSGGRRVGKILSERLGLKYYDKEMLAHAAEKSGIEKHLFLSHDEKRPSLLHSLLSATPGVTFESNSGGLSGDKLYQTLGDVVRELASDGGCVFVGRSADYILRDKPHILSVFLHAPMDVRTQNIMKRGDTSSQAKAREMARSKDRDREKFYNYFTGRKWGTIDNYHLTIDSSMLDDEGVADVIIRHLEGAYRD